jgi:hypothetical protein
VFDWRITGGSSRSVASKARVWPAIALKAVFALETALESCSPRPAIAVVSRAELTMKRESRLWSAFSSWADRDVVVGDAGERGGADHRGRPFVQLLFDFDVDFGQVVFGEADALHRAGGRAADQHLVVGHELAGVLEDQRVLVAAAAAEEDDREDDQGCGQRDDRGDARG